MRTTCGIGAGGAVAWGILHGGTAGGGFGDMLRHFRFERVRPMRGWVGVMSGSSMH